MIRVSVAGLWLILVWLALWENFTPGNIVAGLIVAAVVLYWIPTHVVASPVSFRLLGFIKLILYFNWSLIRSSVIVAWQILTPKPGLPSGIIATPLRASTDGLTTIVVILVSLTPGSLAIEVRPDPGILYIHVLRVTDVDEVRNQVKKLERLVERAFPVIRQVDVPDVPGWEKKRIRERRG